MIFPFASSVKQIATRSEKSKSISRSEEVAKISCSFKHESEFLSGAELNVLVDSSNLNGLPTPLDFAIYTHGNRSIELFIFTSYAKKLATIFFNRQLAGIGKPK